ncbi:MAG: sugar phosphate nucleotidyltransferase [bacterium]|nr:sugar phosphate nucleotidyltransferase [bacterium]
MKAVILAGGIGSRLRPITYSIPKPLLPVGRRPIMEIQIEQLKRAGFDCIYVATGYRSELIEAYFRDGSSFGVNITYSKETKRLGTASPIKLLEDNLSEPFLVMNGDVLVRENFENMYNHHIESGCEMTVCVKDYTISVPYGVIEINKGRVGEIKEKPILKYYIASGIYMLNPSVLKYIPKNEFYDIPDLVKKLCSLDKGVGSYIIKSDWIDIGKEEDYEKASIDIQKWEDEGFLSENA